MPVLIPDQSLPLVNTPIAPPLDNQSPNWGRAPLLDQRTGHFLFNRQGTFVIGNELETVVQRIRKAIATKRFYWKIYDYRFGSDLWTLLGQNMPQPILEDKVKQYITESIEFDSRIQAISTISMVRQRSSRFVELDVLLVNGQYIHLHMDWNH